MKANECLGEDCVDQTDENDKYSWYPPKEPGKEKTQYPQPESRRVRKYRAMGKANSRSDYRVQRPSSHRDHTSPCRSNLGPGDGHGGDGLEKRLCFKPKSF